MPDQTSSKSLRTQTKSAPRWKPFPWSGFTADDLPREKPLPLCPSMKCRRARVCHDAYQGLYCRRTHFSRSEGKQRMVRTEMEKHIASLPRPPENAPLDLRMEFIKEITDLRRMAEREKIQQWRAGAWKDKYGPYRASGFMKSPPPKTYTEE